MYVTALHLYGMQTYPLLLGRVYEGFAEEFQLPSLETLMKSVNEEVTWPATDRLQVHYLDDLMKPNKRHVFEVRFASSVDARELVSIFLSVEESQIRNMSVSFPGRTGRGAFSRMLQQMKSAAHTMRINARDFNFEVQGFPETGNAEYIREHSLSAFVWIEPIKRYLHVREDPYDVGDIKKGRRQL